MKVRMIHALTGSLMYVDESRVNEYRAAGHKPAAPPDMPAPPPEREPERPAKKTKKKG